MPDLETAPARRLLLEGVVNFRDLGGYETADGRRTRWRRLFRSSALQGATDADIQLLIGLGLQRVYDLRAAEELERVGLSRLHDHGVEHVHTPFMERLREQMERDFATREPWGYERMLANAGPAIGRVMTSIAREEPAVAVFHCAAGKDRTGVMAALLLRTLGVPDDTIVEDYTLTREYFTAWRDYSDEQIAATYQQTGYVVTREMLDAAPEVMHRLLAHIDTEHGGHAAYLGTLGVTPDDIESLRTRLLED